MSDRPAQEPRSPRYCPSCGHKEHDEQAAPLDVERLAEAMVESGLMRRFLDYALRAHNSMSRKDTPADLALYWARPVAESYARLSGEPTDD